MNIPGGLGEYNSVCFLIAHAARNDHLGEDEHSLFQCINMFFICCTYCLYRLSRTLFKLMEWKKKNSHPTEILFTNLE